MGIETAIIIGLTAASVAADMSQARKDAKAVTKKASAEALTKAKQTQMQTSKAKVSFLNSGFTLEGTPELSLQGILNAGMEDINMIASNANTQSKNIISKARTDALKSIAKAGASAYKGGMSGGGDSGLQAWDSSGQLNSGWYATQAESSAAASRAGITWTGK